MRPQAVGLVRERPTAVPVLGLHPMLFIHFEPTARIKSAGSSASLHRRYRPNIGAGLKYYESTHGSLLVAITGVSTGRFIGSSKYEFFRLSRLSQDLPLFSSLPSLTSFECAKSFTRPADASRQRLLAVRWIARIVMSAGVMPLTRSA